METTERGAQDASRLFDSLGGTVTDGFPAIHSPVYHTGAGTAYLRTPGVVTLARPQTNVAGLAGFLEGFDPELGFPSYLADPTSLPDSSQLCKTAGQLCYASFGPRRTKNENAAAYFERLTSAGHGCYDGETEVLTAAGWKYWPEVSEEDELATLNPAHEIEYHRPTRLIRYRHEGRMYRVDAPSVDLLVTPDHKMYACLTTTRSGRRKADYRLLSCEELDGKSHAYLKVGNWYDVETSNNLCVYAMLGFAIGDGHMAQDGSRLRFRLRRKRKVSWLRRTCGELGWALSENGERYTVILPEEWRELFRRMYAAGGEKVVPQKLLSTLPKSALRSLLDGMIEADGCRTRTGDCYDTTSETLAGQVQQICLHAGLAANISQAECYEERHHSFGKKPVYRVHIVRRSLKPEVNKFAGAAGRTRWLEDWEGEVYCAEVTNNTLYVRRNGKPVWSGNSVLEHASFSFLLYGISRSVTHELVRHRAGAGFCLTGDTLVYSDHFCNGRREGVKKRSMAQLYEMTKTPHGRSRLRLLRPRSLDEAAGTFTQGRVETVVCSGVKPVFKVELEDGKTITCSRDHRFLTPDGWKPLHQITNGLDISPGGFAVHGPLDTEIMVNGVAAYKDREWLNHQYLELNRSLAEVADMARISTGTLQKWLRKYGLKEPLGVRTRWTFANEGKLYANKAWLEEQYVVTGLDQVSITQLAGVSQHTIRSWVRKHGLQKPTGSWAVGRVPWNMGRRYRAGWNHTPDEADLAKSPPRARGRLCVPRAKNIKSVTYAGEQMTYDLEMEGPNHNFVANGIITHNSQVSQRYVSGAVLRFVERPEYQQDEDLHRLFEERADRAAAEYAAMADRLLERQEGGASMLTADYKTDARKKVQQTARSVLPNETEAPMVFTGNVRALRHIVEMRADAHAESEIRNLAVRIFLCLVTADPILFGDYRIGKLPDGTFTVTTEHRKA